MKRSVERLGTKRRSLSSLGIFLQEIFFLIDKYKALKGKVREIYAIGDCVYPRKVSEAMIKGNRVGRLI